MKGAVEVPEMSADLLILLLIFVVLLLIAAKLLSVI